MASRQQNAQFHKSKTLDNKYMLGDEIGKGAYGRVYKGLDLENGDFVAIKQVSLENIPHEDLSIIMQEIDLLKNLNHKNIVKYLGSLKTKSHLHIILEYVENGSLANIIKPNKFGPFPESLVAVYIAQVLEGLVYLHEQGVIHRDIKGANILTTKEGLVKLADFGVATKLTEADINTHSVVGTPYCMASEPEQVFGRRNLHVFSLPLHMLDEAFQYGPFNRSIQRRWKKPVDSARTRLEGRTRDHRLDKLMIQLKNLRLALDLHELISQQRNGYASLQLLLRWRHELGLNIEIGAFLKKYPHIFEIYVHPIKRNQCCKITQKMADLVAEEDAVIRENEPAIVQRLKKLLMMSLNGTMNMHALWLIRREFGLPDDYKCSILPNHQSEFSLESPDTLTLISRDENLAIANVEEWRDKEYTEKWLTESETKYAFPINFPTGFKIEKGFREKLKNWQRLPYTKPYEKNDFHPIHNVERLEKRIVGILHELLSSTVENMIPLERLSHFRRPFAIEVNLRELLLKHPGIFYISTKGSTQTVLLRESYSKGCLVEPNPVYNVRRKMLGLILSGCRNIDETKSVIRLAEEYNQACSHDSEDHTCQADTMKSMLKVEGGSGRKNQSNEEGHC